MSAADCADPPLVSPAEPTASLHHDRFLLGGAFTDGGARKGISAAPCNGPSACLVHSGRKRLCSIRGVGCLSVRCFGSSREHEAPGIGAGRLLEGKRRLTDEGPVGEVRPESFEIQPFISQPVDLQSVHEGEHLEGEPIGLRVPPRAEARDERSRECQPRLEERVCRVGNIQCLSSQHGVEPHDLALPVVAVDECGEDPPGCDGISLVEVDVTECLLVEFIAALQHSDEELLLRPEVVQDRGPRDAAICCDARQGERVEPHLCDLFRGGFDDLCPAESGREAASEWGIAARRGHDTQPAMSRLRNLLGVPTIPLICTDADKGASSAPWAMRLEGRGMSTMTVTEFDASTARIREGGSLEIETDRLLDALTPDEKLRLLDGDEEFWPGVAQMSQGYNVRAIVMGAIERLGVPGLRFSDGPRGVVMGASTAFPVSMARGATWDIALEERIGLAIGAEMRAQGGNFFGGVCINLPRHPAWGRAQETYGEDPVLLGEFGAALVRGVQHHGMAVAKHYALNSMENARFTVDVTADQQTLHEVFLPHFRRSVEQGVDGIMTAYNSVNGEWAGQNAELMEDILRGQWGFDGVTVSDFIFGLRDAAKSLHNGLDVEEPFRQQRAEHLPADLEAGRVDWADVDRAARRILRTQLRYAARALDDEPGLDVVFSAAHRALAREAAARAAVLLKNEEVDGSPVLPIDPSAVTRMAVIGRLADLPNTGDEGSSNVRSPEVVTPLAGLRAALPDARIDFVGHDDPDAAAAVAASADTAIVVVGYTAQDEGEYLGDSLISNPELVALFPPRPDAVEAVDEGPAPILMGSAAGGDRRSLRVRPVDAEIIRATAAANPRTIVVLITAGAVITEEWRDAVPALLVGWYSGSEGGGGLADVLLGVEDASGRLPYSIPTDEAHLPHFDIDATAVTYDRWFGQRLLDRDGHEAAYPLGFGLSYTSFSIDSLTLDAPHDETFIAHATVTNTGDRPGRHVVQLYASVDAPDFPSRVLVGFATVQLAPGQNAQVEVTGSLRPVMRWTDTGFVPAAPAVTVEASAYSGDPSSVIATLVVA